MEMNGKVYKLGKKYLLTFSNFISPLCDKISLIYLILLNRVFPIKLNVSTVSLFTFVSTTNDLIISFHNLFMLLNLDVVINHDVIQGSSLMHYTKRSNFPFGFNRNIYFIKINNVVIINIF